jgi:tetratricopeptide (TPR) repeat protein
VKRKKNCQPDTDVKTLARLALAASFLLLNACDQHQKSSSPASDSSHSTANSLTKLTAKVRPSVFLLEVKDKDGSAIGTGTGFLINANGWMVTNRHVIERAHTVTAKSENGARYEASGITAYDPNLDLVVLQINCKALPFLPVQEFSVDELNVGEEIAVIGSPLGLEGSLSNGIISAIRTEDQDDSQMVGFIQITAPISPGSSGSPVLRLSGEVIGIATLASKAGYQNLNFAIPSKRLAQLNRPQTIVPFDKFQSKLFEDQIFRSSDFSEYEQARSNSDRTSQLRAAKNMVRRFPENSIAYWYLAESFRILKFFEESIAASKKGLEINPNDHELWTKLGDAQCDAKNTEQAINSFQKSIDLNPNNASSWNNLGWVLLNQKQDYTNAEKALRKAVEIDPARASAWYDLGVTLHLAGKIDDAQTTLEKSVTIDPKNFESWNRLGMIRSSVWKLGKAIEAYQNAVEIDPGRAEAWEGLGDALNRKDRLNESEEAYRKATDVAPGDPQAWINYGRSLVANKREDDAIKVFEKVISISKSAMTQESQVSSSYAFLEIGKILADQEKLDQSIEAFNASIRQSPTNTFAWTGLGISQVRIGKPDNAIKAFKELESQKTDYLYDFYWQTIRDELVKKENAKMSILYCERSIELGISNKVIWYILGRSLAHKNRHSEATVVYQKSLAIFNSEADVWCGLGFSLYRNGKQSEAITSVNKAINLKKENLEKDLKYARQHHMQEDYYVQPRSQKWGDVITTLRNDLKQSNEETTKEMLQLFLDYDL